MNLLLRSEAEEYILLLINTVSMSKFEDFVENIISKKDWYEELCCCYFESNNNGDEIYRFETFEGDTYKMSYNNFLSYVKLAIIRYYLGSDTDEMKERLKEKIKNTVFESSLENIDTSLAINLPLIG